jgi:hypothetical protein
MQLSPKAILRHPWKASRRDWQLLAYHLRDPIAYLLERRKAFDDREVAVATTRMRAYARPQPQRVAEARQAMVA